MPGLVYVATDLQLRVLWRCHQVWHQYARSQDTYGMSVLVSVWVLVASPINKLFTQHFGPYYFGQDSSAEVNQKRHETAMLWKSIPLP